MLFAANDRIIVEPQEDHEQKTEHGLIVSNSDPYGMFLKRGKIVAIDIGNDELTGDMIVYYKREDASLLKTNGKTLHVLNRYDVFVYEKD